MVEIMRIWRIKNIPTWNISGYTVGTTNFVPRVKFGRGTRLVLNMDSWLSLPPAPAIGSAFETGRLWRQHTRYPVLCWRISEDFHPLPPSIIIEKDDSPSGFRVSEGFCWAHVKLLQEIFWYLIAPSQVLHLCWWPPLQGELHWLNADHSPQTWWME